MRLVDADSIKESVKKQCDDCRNKGMRRIADMVEKAINEELDNTPTIEEHKRGRWIENTEPEAFGKNGAWYWKCSNCGHIGISSFNYCPNCGARMESEGDNL